MAQSKILIIDDEESFSSMTKMFLESSGDFEVECVSDSSAAFEKTMDYRPDLILLDIVMPGLDGGDVQAQLQADPALKKIPILFLTSMVSSDDSPNGSPYIRSGGNLLLPKTTEPNRLLRCVRDRLEGRI